MKDYDNHRRFREPHPPGTATTRTKWPPRPGTREINTEWTHLDANQVSLNSYATIHQELDFLTYILDTVFVETQEYDLLPPFPTKIINSWATLTKSIKSLSRKRDVLYEHYHNKYETLARNQLIHKIPAPQKHQPTLTTQQIDADLIAWFQKLNTDIVSEDPTNTGWNIQGGLRGGAEEKRAAPPEPSTPSKRKKSQPPLRVAYQNINGLKAAKLPELHNFLVDNDIDIMFVSEVQKQDGDLFSSFHIPDYSIMEFLRIESKSGGMAVYLKDEIDAKIDFGTGLPNTDTWYDSERIWIRISGERKTAICGVYLRCERTLQSTHYQNNKELLNKLKEEATLLRNQGFAIISWGDYNAHIGDSAKEGIEGNKHPINNNGKLFIDYKNVQKMTMLNNNAWTLQSGDTAKGEGMWSYSKLLDTSTQYSIIDYCIADPDILPFIQKFEVCSTIEKPIESDHVPLLMNIMIGDRKQKQPEDIQPIYGFKTNWTTFKTEVDNRLHKFDDGRISIQHRSNFLADSLLKAYNSSSTRYKQKTKKEKWIAKHTLPPNTRDLITRRQQLSSRIRKTIHQILSDQEADQL